MLDLATENKYFNEGCKYIAGLDEAGRGPLAGPVVAACVIIDKNFKIDSPELEMVADSKKLSAKKREKLFAIIKEKATSVTISVISSESIDKINILKASLLAMKKSIFKSQYLPEIVLVDGNQKIPNLDIKQEAIIDGDAKVWLIAAASIIAKVSRDFLMTEADLLYPEYGFAKHKGYGTAHHREQIIKLGPCPIHRKSFEPIKSLIK